MILIGLVGKSCARTADANGSAAAPTSAARRLSFTFPPGLGGPVTVLAGWRSRARRRGGRAGSARRRAEETPQLLGRLDRPAALAVARLLAVRESGMGGQGMAGALG